MLKNNQNNKIILGYTFLNKPINNSLTNLPKKGNLLPAADFYVTSSLPIIKTNQFQVIVSGNLTKLYCPNYNLPQSKNKQGELIIELYQKYRTDLCYFLDGQFLILVYDIEKKKLTIFNNRYQSTSIYYYLDKELFVFANSMALLLKNLPLKPNFDLNSVPSFLTTGFSFSEKTQFKNIFRLLPTCSIECTNNKVKIYTFWKKELRFTRKTFPNLNEYLDKYENLWRSSIENYLNFTDGTKELGCFLSGGEDTSYVFLQASKIHPKPIHTFTISFVGHTYNEARKAKAINDMGGGIQHIVSIGAEHLDFIPSMIRDVEQPISGGSLPLYLCAREAAKYCGTVLTGDMGNSLWGEYYSVAEWHKYLKRMPISARKMFYNLAHLGRSLLNWEKIWQIEHVSSIFVSNNFYDKFFEKLHSYWHFNEELKNKLLKKDLFYNTYANPCSYKVPFTADNFFDDLIKAKVLYGCYMYIVPLVQKSLESQGVKYFSPYLYHELMEFIMSLPEEWIVRGNTWQKLTNKAQMKFFHKKALKRQFHAKAINSLQQYFIVPWHLILKKRPKVLKRLLIRLQKRGWYKTEELEKMFSEFIKQERKLPGHYFSKLSDHGYRIYSLLLLEVWCMEFIDNFPLENNKKTIVPLEDYLAL